MIDDKNHLFRVACQATIILENEHLVDELYGLGASHVFVGQGFWQELEPLQRASALEDFLTFSDGLFGTQNREAGFCKDLEQTLQTLSRQSIPLLIGGESGSGKTYLAEKIHHFLNPHAPFINKNLSEISPTLVESELFGHSKGAFTGATSDKKGLLETANKGTLFLDEIGTLDLKLQNKLLKVIEEKRFSPVGSNKLIEVDFQLITATCEDLNLKMSQKELREDFYFRIAGLNLRTPSLREHPEEILGLIKKLSKSSSRKLFFTKDCRAEIATYSWPGNIRELNNWYLKLVSGKQSVITKGPHGEMTKGIAQTKLLENKNSLSFLQLKEDSGLPGIVEKVENYYFDQSYRKNRGRPNKVCEDLMISKSVFYRLLKEHPSSRLEQISS
jgi:DNA-binding NtrC family response regulator